MVAHSQKAVMSTAGFIQVHHLEEFGQDCLSPLSDLELWRYVLAFGM